MPNQSLTDAFRHLSMTNNEYARNRDRWRFLYESYVGGQEYREGGHLTRYKLETDKEYQDRLQTTPLDNQCSSVISTYISFLFRQSPTRDLNDWEESPDVQAFLKDCDYEGRSFNDFMKDVSVWSSVFGHCWVMLTKPNVGAVSRAQELEMGVRPYINLMTPLVVSDWRYERSATGAYELVYLKYIEEVIDKLTVVKEWTKDSITTWIMNEEEKTADIKTEEVNELGMIPAVIVYNRRSVVKGIGVSDIADIADLQKLNYNYTSENEQAIRLGTHPTLVVPPTAQVGAGAGAVIVLQEGSDPGLNPYTLEFSSNSVNSIHESMKRIIEAIDRISNTGGVRATETRIVSGVALETEFQLLNARLSDKADNLELAEEQIWKLFGIYQNMMWDGVIKYPDSFSIRDDIKEFDQLTKAKSAATDPQVLRVIDERLLEILDEESELLSDIEYEETDTESNDNSETDMDHLEELVRELIMDGLTDQQILDAITPEKIREIKLRLINEEATTETRISEDA